LKLAPRYAPALQILGTVLLDRGNVQPALDAFRQSLSVNPLNSETYLNMGAAYLRLGNLNTALEMTEKALVIEDEDAPSLQSIGRDLFPNEPAGSVSSGIGKSCSSAIRARLSTARSLRFRGATSR
jgi:tetratricopeptide (TPR) repeat protein